MTTSQSQSLSSQLEIDQQKVTQNLINYVENFKFPYINDINNYERLLKIGQGTFG